MTSPGRSAARAWSFRCLVVPTTSSSQHGPLRWRGAARALDRPGAAARRTRRACAAASGRRAAGLFEPALAVPERGSPAPSDDYRSRRWSARRTRRGAFGRDPYLAEEEQKGQAGEQVEGGADGEGELIAAADLPEATQQRTDAGDANAAHDDLRRGEAGPLARLDVSHAEGLVQGPLEVERQLADGHDHQRDRQGHQKREGEDQGSADDLGHANRPS